MSSSSSSQNEFSHRQGSIMTLPDEEDQSTIASDRIPSQHQHRSEIDESGKVSNLEDVQTASIDLQSVPDVSNDENPISEKESKDTTSNDQLYPSQSPTGSTDDLTTSFGFQQQTDSLEPISKEDNTSMDYESIVRSQKLYYDPNPELIRKPQMITPIIYKQNIMIKFLKPPPIPLGPLIIREVRPPQPPPPPPLVIRQRPPPPLSPPPLILREKPPKIPTILTTQVVTKTLPPLPPPPRSVIIERLPPLPPKPRDVIIERWIPYEATAAKRKVIIQRAEPPKPPPPPRNIIITYERVKAKVLRQFQNHGITPEDPQNYSRRYGDSLLDTKDLLEKVKELGITEDISPPQLIDRDLEKQYESKKFQNGNQLYEKISSNDSDHHHHHFTPTYENLIQETSSSTNYGDSNSNILSSENFTDDLSTQLAQYGLTTESIPY